MSTQTPAWFTAALAQRPQLLAHDVGGAQVVYRAWGGPGQPLAVLVHGGTAHSAWWDHIGPQLATRHRVVAPDLSGHGGSARREVYGLGVWADDVAALIRREGDGGPAVVIGHSMGGWVSLMLAATDPALVSELVVIDSPMSPPVERPERREPPQLRVYDTKAEAVARFRLTPPQDHAVLPYALAHLAETSVHQVAGGWSWTFDPLVWARHRGDRPRFADIGCPVTLLAAERGMLAAEDAGRAAAQIAGPVTIARIPESGHHVMVDEPLALVTAIRLVLGRP